MQLVPNDPVYARFDSEVALADNLKLAADISTIVLVWGERPNTASTKRGSCSHPLSPLQNSPEPF